MRTALPPSSIASGVLKVACLPRPGPCLLEMIAPVIHRASHPSSPPPLISTTPARDHGLALRAARLHAQFPQGLQEGRGITAASSCEGELERCPLYGMMLGGALAGGEQLLRDVAGYYEQLFFIRWMPRMTEEVSSAISALDERRDAGCFIGRLATGIEMATVLQAELKNFSISLTRALDTLKGSGVRMSEDGEQAWQRALMEARGVVHDTNNIVSAYQMVASMVQKRPDFPEVRELLRSLQDFDFSSVRSTVNFVAKMHTSRAGTRGVEIRVGAIPRMIVAEEQRISLFRAINELVENSLKYADPGKDHRQIVVSADAFTNFVRIQVADNGVGIENLAKVFERLDKGEGLRERPDLASGDGRGLATIARQAMEESWGFYLVSGKGFGTNAGLYLEVARLKEYVAPPKTRRSSRPPAPEAVTRSVSPWERLAQERPELAAATVDMSSLLRTVQLFGRRVGRYDFFPRSPFQTRRTLTNGRAQPEEG